MWWILLPGVNTHSGTWSVLASHSVWVCDRVDRSHKDKMVVEWTWEPGVIESTEREKPEGFCVHAWQVASVVSNSLWPHDYSPPGPSVHGIFPGKNIGVGCHFLLQGIFPKHRSNPYFMCLLHCRWILYHWATATNKNPWVNSSMWPTLTSHKVCDNCEW